MSVVLFLLCFFICIGAIYMVHKYFGKFEFYLLGIIYVIISFLMSFKLINIFGFDINAGIIFGGGLLVIIYYFIKRYDIKEYKKFIMLIFLVSLVCSIFLLSSTFMIPSIYDKNSLLYQNLVLDNLVIVIMYPITLLLTSSLSGYCFNELKGVGSNSIKMIITIIGIMFIDVFVFVYFSYAVLIGYEKAIIIAIYNYIIKSIIMVCYVFTTDKILSIKKVK